MLIGRVSILYMDMAGVHLLIMELVAAGALFFINLRRHVRVCTRTDVCVCLLLLFYGPPTRHKPRLRRHTDKLHDRLSLGMYTCALLSFGSFSSPSKEGPWQR